MRRRTRTVTILTLIGALVGLSQSLRSVAAPRHPDPTLDPRPPGAASGRHIQIALLLDTSGSMDGLIEQAKSQLWKIVNEFARSKRDGVRPRLELALYEYGKSSLSAEGGWVRQIVPLTEDLDRVSEELFALRTNGGEEYCGKVIQAATRELAWSGARDDLKLIFIAGNEPFTQGPVPYADAVRSARERGIRVSTIHCGPNQEPGWVEAAKLADGQALTIDQNRAVAHVAAPEDDEIARLGLELNRTYVAYGAAGHAASARQNAQDQNARSAGAGSLVERAVSKSSALYRNESWDLVDAVRDRKVSVAAAPAADLPTEMRAMSAPEREAYVARQAAERGRLQRRIAELDAKRRAWVAAEMKKRAAVVGGETLDGAVLDAVHAQGAKLGYQFE